MIILGMICLVGFNVAAQSSRTVVEQQAIKYNSFLQMVNAFYVDTVNVVKLTENAIVKVLERLDPHSVYLSQEEVMEANEPLEGGFFGIGIQFSILQDTLVVMDVISGGPSERVGLLSGDRITAIDEQTTIGVGLTNSDVRKRLKGEEGTLVKVRVSRGKNQIDFNIRRGMIPIYSVDASYMLDEATGYIKIARFAATTLQEFEEAMQKLLAKGMKDLVIDLQGNGGGYMGAAITIADHILDSHRLIVYTEGRSGRLEDYYSKSSGLFQTGRVVVLQDGYSASASEILAGAIQDWDRGIVVGRRSFGKGLVQRQMGLQDGSMIRLTVAHYFTPSGRNIQKPYDKEEEDYQTEVFGRYSSGELFSSDSIHIKDTTRYYTRSKHRTVYGGGGIIPDIFVPVDTTINYLYFNQLLAKGIVQEYELSYLDKNRNQLKKSYPNFERFHQQFQVSDKMIEEIIQKGESQGIKKDEKHFALLEPEIRQYVKSLIARDLWGMNELYRITNEDNALLQAALKALKDGTYEQILN